MAVELVDELREVLYDALHDTEDRIFVALEELERDIQSRLTQNKVSLLTPSTIL